jgi:hypothetical protein
MPSAIVQPAHVISPPLIPTEIAVLSDEQCLHRLANAVDAHDSDHLNELAQLLGRLAVVIE